MKQRSGSDYWGWIELSGNPGRFDTSGQRVSTPYKLAGLQGFDPFSEVPQRLHLALLVAAPSVADVFSWVTGAGQCPAIWETETCIKSGSDDLLVSHWPSSSSARDRRISASRLQYKAAARRAAARQPCPVWLERKASSTARAVGESSLMGVLPGTLWLMLAQVLDQQAVRFACISNELAVVVEAFCVDADDFCGGWAFVEGDAVGW